MTIPKLFRPIYERAMTGKASPRDAIKAKCQECCGWEDVIERVGNCTIKRCPLWLYRPYQQDAGRAEAVSAATGDAA